MDILVDDTNIDNAILSKQLYTNNKSGIVKELDISLYKLIIYNYFKYLTNSDTGMEIKIFEDNSNTGFIRYYKDLLILAGFGFKYYELIPLYINHLNNNVLNKYYTKISAIKSLPS